MHDPAVFKFCTYATASPVDMWGVLFSHPNGAGHCVVFEQGEFRDYQPDPVQMITGPETDEIEDRICFVFSISDHDVTQDTEATGTTAEEEEHNERSDQNMDVDEEIAEEPTEVEEEPVEEEPQQDEEASGNDGMNTNEDDEMADGTNQE